MATLKAQRATAIETSCSKYGIFIAAWSSVFHLDSNRNWYTPRAAAAAGRDRNPAVDQPDLPPPEL